MKLPTGKGYYIWQIPRIGTPQEIAIKAKDIGLSHVFVKIANGFADYGIENGEDLAKQLCDELKKVGVEPWGWQYVYNNYPEREASKAVERIRETGVVGFDIDAESEAKNRPNQAKLYCEVLRNGVGDGFPVGLGSYRFPTLHPELPWAVFRAYCNFDMPQVYWVQAHNPAAQLTRSIAEFAAMPKKLPYVGTGSAYRQEYPPYWIPSTSEIIEFMATAKLQGIAFNFWEWYDAEFILPQGIWDAIAEWENGLSMEDMVDVLWREAKLHGWDLEQ
jgi:hypothetical protein